MFYTVTKKKKKEAFFLWKKLEYIAPKTNYICLVIKVSSNVKMLELNYAHISGEAFQFIFGQ